MLKNRKNVIKIKNMIIVMMAIVVMLGVYIKVRYSDAGKIEINSMQAEALGQMKNALRIADLEVNTRNNKSNL